MSTLTKICVVLLVILVLFACTVFIQKAVTGTNWKEYAFKQRQRANLANADSRAHMLASQTWKRMYEEAVAQALSQADNLQQTVKFQRTKIGELNRDVADLKRQVNEASAHSAALQSTVDQQVKQNAGLRGELKTQRDKNISLGDQLRRALDQIREYLISLENAQKEAKFLREQLADKEGEIKDQLEKIKQLQDEVTRLKQGAGGTVAAAASVAPSGDKIDGEVLAVEGDMVSLNVGSASGVKKGTEFTLFRQGTFIAHLKIEQVGPSTCAGIVFDRTGVVKRGDKASTRLE